MLTPEQDARVTAALAVAHRNLDEAHSLVTPWYLRGYAYVWDWFADTDTVRAGARSNEHSTEVLVANLDSKAAAFRRPDIIVEDIEVADFEAACGATDNAATREAVELIDPRTAIKETVAPSDPDAPALWPPSRWPWWVWAVLGVVTLGALGPWALLLGARRRAP